VVLFGKGRRGVLLLIALLGKHAGDGRPPLPVVVGALAIDGCGLDLVLGVGLGEALVEGAVGAAALVEALLHLADAGFEGFELGGLRVELLFPGFGLVWADTEL
jgi:hypothetical protein